MKIQLAFFLVLVGLALSEAGKGKGKRRNRLAQACKTWTKRCQTSLEKGADKKMFCVFDGEKYIDVEDTFACIKKDVMVCSREKKVVHPGSCGQCDESLFCKEKNKPKKAGKRAGKKNKGRKNNKKKGGRRGMKQVCDQTGKTYEKRCDLHMARCQGVAENIPFADLPKYSPRKCPAVEPEANQA